MLISDREWETWEGDGEGLMGRSNYTWKLERDEGEKGRKRQL